MSFKKRLLKLQFRFDLNGRTFAKQLGYKDPEKIQRLTRDEKNSPSYKILRDILEAFPGLNARWLITGEGEMFEKDEKNIDIKGGQNIFSDSVAQYGKNSTLQKSGNDNEDLLSLKKELELKTKEIELQQKQLDNQDKLIARYEKLLDK